MQFIAVQPVPNMTARSMTLKTMTARIAEFATTNDSSAGYRNFKRHFSRLLNVSDGGRAVKRAPIN